MPIAQANNQGCGLSRSVTSIFQGFTLMWVKGSDMEKMKIFRLSGKVSEVQIRNMIRIKFEDFVEQKCHKNPC